MLNKRVPALAALMLLVTACLDPMPTDDLTASTAASKSIVVGVVEMEPTGATYAHAMGTAHEVTLLNANTAYGALQAVIGADVPTIGIVVAIDAPRQKFYPAGTQVGLVVAP